MRRLLVQAVTLVIAAVLGVVAVGAGYDVARSRAAASIYKQRLTELAGRHQRLVDHYNDAVRRTTVTELVVREDEATGGDDGAPAPRTLSVRLRDDLGTAREIATAFDPTVEIYVDYVVLDGRLFIRRVFDANTAPADALVLDPELAAVDWDDPRTKMGKAVYRSLGPGRWEVSVTGAGALGLVRAGDPDEVPAVLAEAPAIEEFEEIESEVQAAEESIGLSDVWAWIVGD